MTQTLDTTAGAGGMIPKEPAAVKVAPGLRNADLQGCRWIEGPTVSAALGYVLLGDAATWQLMVRSTPPDRLEITSEAGTTAGHRLRTGGQSARNPS